MNIQKEKIKKILIISLQGIGDLLIFSPCLPIIKKNILPTKISMLVLDSSCDILRENKYVDEIIPFKYKEYNLYNAFKLLMKIRREKFDLAICAYPSGPRAAFFCFFSGAPLRCGHRYDYLKYLPFLFNIRVCVPEIKHAVEINLDLMKSLGLEATSGINQLVLQLSTDERDFAQNFLISGKYPKRELLIGMHATGADFRKNKCWPIENFVELTKKLIKDFSANVLLLGVRDELEPAKRIEEINPNLIINAVGKTTLRQAAALIEKCNLFIGNDSALIHLAAAVGTPTVVIFGPTDPRIYAPYGVKHKIIRKPLECSPCAWGACGRLDLIKKNSGFIKGRFYCKRGDFECIKGILLEEVYSAVKEFITDLSKYKNG